MEESIREKIDNMVREDATSIVGMRSLDYYNLKLEEFREENKIDYNYPLPPVLLRTDTDDSCHLGFSDSPESPKHGQKYTRILNAKKGLKHIYNYISPLIASKQKCALNDLAIVSLRSVE